MLHFGATCRVLSRYAAWGAAWFAGLAIMVMMLLGAADVISTNVFSQPVTGTVELTRSLLVASVFLALALSQQRGRQIRVTLLVERLPTWGQHLSLRIAALCSLLVYLAIAWYGWLEALDSWQSGEASVGALRFAIWPARFALAIGASLMVLQCFADTLLPDPGKT